MYSVTKAAQLLKVHPNTIRNAIKTEKLYAETIQSLTGFTYVIRDLDLFYFAQARKISASITEIDRKSLELQYLKLTRGGTEEGAWANE